MDDRSADLRDQVGQEAQTIPVFPKEKYFHCYLIVFYLHSIYL